MKHCPACTQPNEESALDCTTCGYSFDSGKNLIKTVVTPESGRTKHCPSCMQENDFIQPSCESCGYAFGSKLGERKTEVHKHVNLPPADSDLIANRYQRIKILGRGGMGVVYLVKDTELSNHPVALKMINLELIGNPQAKRRFTEEVIICQKLAHSNIVRIHDLKRWEESRFFTMEYIDGCNLRDWINKHSSLNPPFNFSEVMSVIDPLLDALAYAHRFTIHRDIKPENIMIEGKFPEIQIKVMDFGLAKLLSGDHYKSTVLSGGTAYYQAPEQMYTGGKIDHRADIYAVGIVLYEMLTGKIATGRFTMPSILAADVPTEIDEVVSKALSQDPEERYESAQQMREALDAVYRIYQSSKKKIKNEKIKRELIRGGKLLTKGQYSESRDAFETVLQLDSANDQATLMLRRIQKEKRQFDDLQNQLAISEKNNDPKSSLTVLDQLLRLVPDSETIRTNKATIEKILAEQESSHPTKGATHIDEPKNPVAADDKIRSARAQSHIHLPSMSSLKISFKVSGVLYIALALFVGVALFSYHHDDPTPFIDNHPVQIKNFFGIWGAHMAGFFINLVGITSFYLPFVFLLRGVQIIFSLRTRFFLLHLVGTLLFLSTAGALASFVQHRYLMNGAYISTGGTIGNSLKIFLVSLLNPGGAKVLLISLLLLAIYLSIGFKFEKRTAGASRKRGN
jgi:serine/threonine protein kinase